MNDVVEQTKSPCDRKQYRLLTLPNDLQVLLISMIDVPHSSADDEEAEELEDDDSTEDDDDDISSDNGSDQRVFDEDEGAHGPHRRRAGACLTVGVGSFAEPEHLPGLAHYLEHMLFMGSEKYPDENEFESFLSAHGGYSNGQTDNEMTSFTFEVGPAYLERSLDMFAHFFISPLMKSDALDRELSAIESEFSQAAQSDQVRIQQVLCDTAPPSHPYGRFGWGNERSLKLDAEIAAIDVNAEIREFYDTFYSANLMKLVVCGDEDLDTLEAWVRASFSEIPNKNVTRPDFALVGNPFGAGVDASPIICRIVPVRDIQTMHLNWMIPPVFGQHRQKPTDYVASLLGHESEGSLLSHLKRKGWISSITAGVTDSDGFDAGTYGAKFDLTMKLTAAGLEHWESIVEAVFEYLVMLQSSGLPEWLYDELQALADISFRFQEETSAVEQCEELAQIMQDMFMVPPQDILRYNLYIGAFQPSLVRSLLGHLTPANLRVLLVSQNFLLATSGLGNQFIEEKWFGVKYTKDPIPNHTLERWCSVSHTHQDIQLPLQNPFIPSDFTIIPESSLASGIESQSCEFGILWFKPDPTFRTPRASIAFLIQLPSISRNPESYALTELFVKLVRDSLNEFAYHANVAELMYSLHIKDSGLELIFGGFNDKLGRLVELVAAKLFDSTFEAQRFDLLKQDLLREYRNAHVKSAHKAKYLRLQLLERRGYRHEELIAAGTSATLPRLKSFVSNEMWRSSAFLATLAHVNLAPEKANQLHRLIEAGLRRSSSPMSAESQVEWPVRDIVQLPISPPGLLLQSVSDHTDDKNTHVEYYFQFGEHSVRMLAYADLLHQLMEEPLFDSLRTKQELGYDVSCTVRLTHGVIGFGITVQSSLFKAAYIRSCIDQFLFDFKHAIASMPKGIFQDHVHAQILKKLEPDHTLFETTQRYWYEITSGRLIFDINERLAGELELCTKNELLVYYQEAILQNPRKLVVQIIGQASPDVIGDRQHQAARPPRSSRRKSSQAFRSIEPTLVDDLYHLKTQLSVYPDRFQLQHPSGGTTARKA